MKLFLTLSFLIVIVSFTFAQEFKTVGYFPHYRFEKLDNIEFEKLTHVNISFANPDMEGNISVGEGKDITNVVAKAHEAGAEVFVALAGGYLTPEWKSAWNHNMLHSNRSAFINKIMAFLREYDLQGLDMDLEWDHVDEYYSPFVIELSDSLKAEGLTFTAALPGTYRYPEITDEALAVFDWINMMAYDLRGSWNPLDAGPHSPYSFAVSSMNNWVEQGVSKDKLTLGVPFYGYNFINSTTVEAMTFNQIVNLDPENAQKDKAGNIYYNGIPTIIDKTNLALAELSGIMIWEIGQDNYGEFSLLSTIYETVTGAPLSVYKSEVSDFTISPNPFDQLLTVTSTSSQKDISYEIYDMSGRLIIQGKLSSSIRKTINTANLSAGAYVLQLSSVDDQATQLIIKN